MHCGQDNSHSKACNSTWGAVNMSTAMPKIVEPVVSVLAVSGLLHLAHVMSSVQLSNRHDYKVSVQQKLLEEFSTCQASRCEGFLTHPHQLPPHTNARFCAVAASKSVMREHFPLFAGDRCCFRTSVLHLLGYSTLVMGMVCISRPSNTACEKHD